MSDDIHLARVEPQPIAVVRRLATIPELPVVVPEACGGVWDFLRAHHVMPAGRNVAVYLDDVMHLEVGVEVSSSFTGEGEISRSWIPGGLVATSIHIGPYAGLPKVHEAVRAWSSVLGEGRVGVPVAEQ